MAREYRDGSVDVKNKGILSPEGVKGLVFPRLAKTAEIIGGLELRAFSRRAYTSEPIENTPDDKFVCNQATAEHYRIARCVGAATLAVASLVPISHAAEPIIQTAASVYEEHVTEPLSKLALLRPEA